MKKLLTLFLCSTLFISFMSCSEDSENETSLNAFAKITVNENQKAKSGVTVHMFDSNSGPNTEFFTSFFSKKKVITESDGIATFNLLDTFDLEVIDTQTTLYFAVFDGDEILGQTALTIEKGETKSTSINY